MFNTIPIGYWQGLSAAPVGLRVDLNAALLTNTTQVGTDTLVDQDNTDGQINSATLNWNYTTISPSAKPTLNLGVGLVGNPRGFSGLFGGGAVVPVGVKDFEAYVNCKLSGNPSAVREIPLFRIEAGLSAFNVNIKCSPGPLYQIWVFSGGGIYEGLTTIPINTSMAIGIRGEANGANSNIRILVNGAVLNTVVYTGNFGQIQGSVGPGIDDDGNYDSALAIEFYRYRLYTL